MRDPNHRETMTWTIYKTERDLNSYLLIISLSFYFSLFPQPLLQIKPPSSLSQTASIVLRLGSQLPSMVPTSLWKKYTPISVVYKTLQGLVLRDKSLTTCLSSPFPCYSHTEFPVAPPNMPYFLQSSDICVYCFLYLEFSSFYSSASQLILNRFSHLQC